MYVLSVSESSLLLVIWNFETYPYSKSSRETFLALNLYLATAMLIPWLLSRPPFAPKCLVQKDSWVAAVVIHNVI